MSAVWVVLQASPLADVTAAALVIVALGVSVAALAERAAGHDDKEAGRG